MTTWWWQATVGKLDREKGWKRRRWRRKWKKKEDEEKEEEEGEWGKDEDKGEEEEEEEEEEENGFELRGSGVGFRLIGLVWLAAIARSDGRRPISGHPIPAPLRPLFSQLLLPLYRVSIPLDGPLFDLYPVLPSFTAYY